MLALGFSASSMNTNPGRGINHNCIHVISMSNNQFNFKSDKDVSGATVDVYDFKTGKKVMSQTITDKHTTIDLSSQDAGDYIVLITKGDFKRKYVYHKN
jgi:hypothetical protein